MGEAAHYVTQRLGNLIASVRAGTSVNSEDRPRRHGEIAVLKTGAVADGRFLPDEHKVVVAAERSRASCPVRADTIIVSRMNTKELVGESGYVPHDFPDLFLPDRLWAIRAKRDVDSRWLGQLLASPVVRTEIGRRASGTSGSMKNLSQEALLGIEVPVPPLPEQRRIVAVLDAWEEGVALGERLVVAKRRRKEAIAHRLLHGTRDDARRLGEVVTIGPRTRRLEADAEVSFVTMDDVSEHGRLVRHEARARSEIGNGYTTFLDGDVLVAKITPCFENGKGAFAENLHGGAGFGSTEFHVLRAGPEVLPRYVYHLTITSDFRLKGERMMTGSAGQRRVPSAFIEDYRVAVPRLETQERVVALLDAMTAEIDLLAACTDLLRRQKRALAERLLSGALRVPGGVALDREDAA